MFLQPEENARFPMEGEFPIEEINFRSFVTLWLPVTMLAAIDPEHVAELIEV
jgi:hypothetical protein